MRTLGQTLARRAGSELAKSSALSLGIRVFGLALTFAFSLIVTNFLGPAAFGDYTFLVLVINVLSILSALGLDALVVRFASGRVAQNDWAGLRTFDRTATWMQVTAAVGIAVILLVLTGLGCLSLLGSGLLFGVAALGILPQTLLKYRAQAFKALRKIGHYALFSYVAVPLLSLLFLGVFWVWQGASAPSWAYLAALIGASGTAIFFWKKTLRDVAGVWNLSSTGRPQGSPLRGQPGFPSAALAPDLLRQAWPFLLTGSLMFLNHWADQLILKMMRGSYELGIYAAAARIVNLVTIPLLAVNSIVAPRLAGLWAQEDRAGLRRTARQATRLIFWSSAPLFLIVFVFAEFIIGWFGPEFAGGATAMRILLIGQCCNVLVGPTGALLNMTRYERLMNRLALLSLVVNVVLNLLLVPGFGAMGAAIGSALGLVVLNGTAWWFVRRRLGFSTVGFNISRKGAKDAKF